MSFAAKSSSTRQWLQLTLLLLSVQIITQIDAASISIDPDIYPITAGQTSTFKCYVSFVPESPTITWKIGNRVIDSSYHATRSSSASSSGISITDELRYPFQSSDHEQTITCTARQPDGSWISSYTQLNVVQSQNVQQPNYVPVISSNKPGAAITDVTIDLSTMMSIRAGQMSTVDCHVSFMHETPTITWKIGNREIDSSYHGPMKSHMNLQGEGGYTDTLRYNFQSYDNGQTITCMARLSNGSWKSSYTQLRVL